MKKNPNNFLGHFSYWLRVAIVGLALGLGLQFVRAWTEPTVAPPNGNVGAPLNTGSLGQYKVGGLMLNTGDGTYAPAANGLIVQNGSVGIGTASPVAKLEVSGGPIKATGGLIIETRASDPPSPVNGQLWLISP